MQIPEVLQWTLFRGGSVSFKPITPTRHYFQSLKCFLNLDTSGKFWKILQEGDEAKESSFSHAIQEALHKIFALQDSQLRSLTHLARESLEMRGVLWGTG